MDVRCVAEEERAAFAELRRDSVVHVIRREPIDSADVEAELLDRATTDVLERKLAALDDRFPFESSDEPNVVVARHREYRQEIGLAKVDMQFAIDGRSARFDVGDVEDPLVAPTGKANAGER